MNKATQTLLKKSRPLRLSVGTGGNTSDAVGLQFVSISTQTHELLDASTAELGTLVAVAVVRILAGQLVDGQQICCCCSFLKLSAMDTAM